MRPNIAFWLPITCLVVTTAVGDYCSKLASLSTRPAAWIGLFLAYNLGVLFWMLMLRQVQSLALAGMLWGLLSTIVIVLIGRVMFHEALTMDQWFGIVLGLLALYFIL